MDFFTYIKAVGTGVKGNRDLTYQESEEMMHQILQQSVHGEQIASFLIAWRLKPETITEYQGALAACDKYILKKHIANSIELGYPYDGKVRNPYIIPLVAKMLHSSDLQIVLIGDDKQPAKNGVTLQEISQHIDFDENIHYFERSSIFKNLHELTALRNRLGLRTAFNTLEKLHHAADSNYAITGLFHKPYLEKYAAIFGDRYARLALLQGNEGSPELFKKSNLYLVENGAIKEFSIDPGYYGIKPDVFWEAQAVEDYPLIMQNPSESLTKLAKLNAAILLFVANRASSIDDGYEILRD